MINLDSHLREYHYYLTSELHLSSNTWKNYESDVEKYIDFLVKNYKINNPKDIQISHLKSYIDTPQFLNKALKNDDETKAFVEIVRKYHNKEDLSNRIDEINNINGKIL